ncbi:MAG: PD-(D/E)XK nuclease family protein [Nitrosarchaeum sp.]|nr:PD-(D/E)XK nuclease family protein [Nitrosarchaeum sp.]
MQKLEFNLSASTLSSFVTCPWAFKQDKILKRPCTKVPSVALVLGQALHKLFEQFYKRATWNTHELFTSWEQFFDIETKVQGAKGLPYLPYAKASGFTMIKNWVAMAKAEGWLIDPFEFEDGKCGIELEFMLPYDNDRFLINVHGYMDLVIEVNGKIYILDWKSGKHATEKYRLQAIMYSWALYKRYGLIEDCVRFVHPAKKENRIVDVHVENKDYLEIKNTVDELFTAIETNCFIKKNDESHCKWCSWSDCKHNCNEQAKKLVKKEVVDE